LNLLEGNKDFGLALIVMVVFACIGLIAAILLPASRKAPQQAGADAQTG